MAKSKKLSELTKEINKDSRRRARVDQHKEAINQALMLAELREHRQLTQTRLADRLKVSQENVSRIERRSQQEEVYLTTLRRYVEALGGQLQIQAVFKDETVTIAGPNAYRPSI